MAAEKPAETTAKKASKKPATKPTKRPAKKPAKRPAKKPTKKAAKRTPTKAATKPASKGSVGSLLKGLDAATRADCERIDRWMSEAVGAAGVLWGPSIAGYGTTMVRYASGEERPWMKLGFAPRKQAIVLYGISAAPDALARLGKHSTGKGCLYVRRLSDVDEAVLRALIVGAARR